jgi:plasmid stability protein
MASLTLKNLPDDLLRALRRAAQKDHRSLTREIIHRLESSLRGGAERPAPRAHDASAQVAAWRRLAGKWESDVDRATEAKRLMERRTSGRGVDL